MPHCVTSSSSGEVAGVVSSDQRKESSKEANNFHEFVCEAKKKGRFKAKGVRLTNRKNGQAEKKRKESHFVTLTPGRVRVREREL